MPSETEREARERRVLAARSDYPADRRGLRTVVQQYAIKGYVRGAEYEAPIARQAERAAIVDDLRELARKMNGSSLSRSVYMLADRYEAGAHTEEE